MQRFRFALERVLRLRHQQLEQAKRALGLAIAAAEAARQQVLAADRAVINRVAAVQSQAQQGMAAFRFAAERTYLAFLQRELAREQVKLEQAQAQVLQRRSDLLAARRREMALERLRDRRWAEYQLESLRVEQQELDQYGSRPGLKGTLPGADI